MISTCCSTCGSILPEGTTICAPCMLMDAAGDEGRTEFTPGGEPGAGVLGRVDGHELLEMIARGGMGMVYRARQLEPRREVTLKALPGSSLLSAESLQRFRLDRVALTGLRPSGLPHHRTCGFPHPAVEFHRGFSA